MFRIVESIPDKGYDCPANENGEPDPWAHPAEWSDSGESLLEAFLQPTALYVKPSLAAIATGQVKALCHITGGLSLLVAPVLRCVAGGLLENLPRIMPPNLTAELTLNSYDLPRVFKWLQYTGNVANEEMLKVFNCGVGMVIVCAPDAVDLIEDKIGQTIKLGSLIARQPNLSEDVTVKRWWVTDTYSA